MKIKIIGLSIVAAAFLMFSLTATAKHHPIKKERHGKKAMSIADMTANLQFDFAKATLRPAYHQQLDELAKLIISGNKALVLRGHADAIGNYVSNWKLSQKRAAAVKDYLLTKGVPSPLIVTVPFGSTIPIASNSTPTGRQKNRRVEIKLH
jgi:OOP family OmpA-OmpF porin